MLWKLMLKMVEKPSYKSLVYTPFFPAARVKHEYTFANMNIHQSWRSDIRIRTSIDGEYSLISKQYSRIFYSTVINRGLPDEYSRISTSPKPDIRIRTNSTATSIHEYEYSRFANGLARIFVIFDIRATLYLQLK
ncbi:hypothetical protein B0H11DRAFT_1924526 [Mycena galericulata]|nr:hypothetical protein B0H11DRAFT_1924526 [Mycena galericulata]